MEWICIGTCVILIVYYITAIRAEKKIEEKNRKLEMKRYRQWKEMESREYKRKEMKSIRDELREVINDAKDKDK